MGRPLEKKYNGKMSFNFSAFTRAALLVYAANFNLPAQGANERIILERVEADGLQDAVALRALEMVQADPPAPVDTPPNTGGLFVGQWVRITEYVDGHPVGTVGQIVGFHGELSLLPKVVHNGITYIEWDNVEPCAYQSEPDATAPAPLVEAVDASTELRS